MENKIKGCLIGAVVGDALGTRYEFSSRQDAESMLKNDGLNILGGGPFHLAPGQPTDDSELMLSLLNAIVAADMKYDKEIVAKYYINWYKSEPFDIGNATKNAFSHAFNYHSIRSSSHIYNVGSKSNGCLMRSMPLGILAITDQNLAVELPLLDTSLTNPNPDCINIVQVYCMMIAMSILNYSKTDIFARILTLANLENRRIIRNSLKHQIYSIDGEYIQPDSHMGGFYGIAIQNALYHFFNNHTFEKAMYDTIRLGGDTDTNCCILGGLLGSYGGLSTIPVRFVDKVFLLENPSYNRHKKLPIVHPENMADTIDKLVSTLLATFT